MTQQGLRQASVRARTGTTYDYNGDWHALFDLDGIPAGDFNGRMVGWLQKQLGTSDDNLPGLMQRFASLFRVYNWSSLGLFFFDNFNRANEDLGASPDWTRVDGTAGGAAIRSNVLASVDTDTVGTAYHSPDLGAVNHFVEYELRDNLSAGAGFVCCRLVDAGDFVGVRNNFGAYQMFKRVGESFTEMGATGAGAAAVGDLVRLEVRGSMARVLLNGVQVISPTSLGSDLLTGTRQGVVSRLAARNPWIDNYRAGAL